MYLSVSPVTWGQAPELCSVAPHALIATAVSTAASRMAQVALLALRASGFQEGPSPFRLKITVREWKPRWQIQPSEKCRTQSFMSRHVPHGLEKEQQRVTLRQAGDLETVFQFP